MDNEKKEVKTIRNQIEEYVKETIASFARRNPANVKRDLAILRRGAGKELQDVPDLWSLILDNLPDKLMGNDDKPSISEEAIYQTLILFALAQQGHDPVKQLQNENGISLGAAAGRYAKKMENKNNAILNRLKQAVTANTVQGMTVHLRGMIKLFAREGICLDFAMLAGNLYQYNFQDGQKRVRLAWARDYFKNLKSNSNEETSTILSEQK